MGRTAPSVESGIWQQVQVAPPSVVVAPLVVDQLGSEAPEVPAEVQR